MIDGKNHNTSLFETRLASQGITQIAGVDEVGRGCLAGPVVAAAVILPYPCKIEGVKDSKKLTPKKREALYSVILETALAFSFGFIEPEEIDQLNIYHATLKAMKLAVESLRIKPQYLLVDGSQVVPTKLPQLSVPKGDNRSISIAAASIVAKVTRDRIMALYEKEYPTFKFSMHKGYGTALHLKELKINGITHIHRRSFNRVTG